VTVKFTVENSQSNEMTVKGTTTIKRTVFGVGQGDWADTKEVKDDVKVDFILNLKR